MPAIPNVKSSNRHCPYVFFAKSSESHQRVYRSCIERDSRIMNTDSCKCSHAADPRSESAIFTA